MKGIAKTPGQGATSSARFAFAPRKPKSTQGHFDELIRAGL